MADVIKKLSTYVIFWNVSDAYDALKPFQYISWLFGYGFMDHFRLRRGQKTCLLDYIFLVFWLSLMSAIIYGYLMNDYLANWTDSVMLRKIRRWFSVFSASIGCFFMISSFASRKRFTEMFTRLIDIDRELSSMRILTDLKLESLKINLINLFAYSGLIGILIYTSIGDDDCDNFLICLYQNVPIYVMVFVFQFYNIHFFVFTVLIIRRYNTINVTLPRMTKIKLILPQTKFLMREMTPIMRLARLHDELTQCVDDINVTFSIQIMLTFSGIFMIIVSTLFSLLHVILAKNSSIENFIPWLVIMTIYVTFAVLLTTVYISNKVMSCGKHTAVVIHRALFFCDDEQIREDLKVFSQQLSHRYPVVTCGLFTFDWTLVFSIMSAVTTYLMLLIQFDTSFQSGGGDPQCLCSGNISLDTRL